MGVGNNDWAIGVTWGSRCIMQVKPGLVHGEHGRPGTVGLVDVESGLGRGVHGYTADSADLR